MMPLFRLSTFLEHTLPITREAETAYERSNLNSQYTLQTTRLEVTPAMISPSETAL